MTRFLLTLLALLTGFVAQTVPASARLGAAAGAEVTIQLPGNAKRVVIVSQVASRPAAARKWNAQPCIVIAPQRAVPVPTVLPGIDRARE